jgi:hypothetical protein
MKTYYFSLLRIRKSGARIFSLARHSREGGNPDAVPVKTGNQNKNGLDARLRTSGMTEQRHWIPPYPVRGKPGMTNCLRLVSSCITKQIDVLFAR